MIEKGEGFGISNFRSFDKKGVYLKNINQVNILIGKNNSGKSNLLYFLKLLSENSRNNSIQFPKKPENKFRNSNEVPHLIFELFLSEIGVEESFQIQPGDGTFQNKIGPEHRYFFPLQDSDIVDTTIDFSKLSNQQLLVLLNHLTNTSSKTTSSPDANIIYSIKYIIFKKLKEKVTALPRVIYVPNFRLIKEGNKIDDSNSGIDGSNIISEMFKMTNPDIGEELRREQFQKIVGFVKNLLNVDSLELEIPHSMDKIIVELYGNRLPLELFGTGIHQLVILCTAIVINPKAIICIEEPEIHIHPELQRKFIKFLESTDNIYFISTHSNVFLDYSSKKSIYHVQYDGMKSTIDYINTSTQTHKILSDLGYKQSDLLQSNGVIWVEGPSDRIYLNRWISLLDNKLEEGLHYSIMFYGGRLLSHLTLKSDRLEYFEKHLIPVLHINRNAVVLIDKDARNTDSIINSTKQRIANELCEENCWITEGREIENYISDVSINNWLISKGNTQSVKLGKYNKIEDITSKLAKDIKFNYASNKVKFANEIVPLINKNNLNKYDLSERLNVLIEKIKVWNNQ